MEIRVLVVREVGVGIGWGYERTAGGNLMTLEPSTVVEPLTYPGDKSIWN